MRRVIGSATPITGDGRERILVLAPSRHLCARRTPRGVLPDPTTAARFIGR
jgi:hypothetical protein